METQFPTFFFSLYRRLILRIYNGSLVNNRLIKTLLSKVFECVVSFRKKFRLQRSQKVAPFVISVGNIVLGGAGKTPFVLWLVDFLTSKGCKCAILTRGYKGSASKLKEPTIVNPLKHSAKFVGDEPLLMARRCPGVPVIVNRNRYLSAKKAEVLGCDVVILDDGGQNTHLKKDFNFLIVRGNNPLGGGSFYPKGTLRDFPETLHDADMIVINGALERQDTLGSFLKPKIHVDYEVSSINRYDKNSYGSEHILLKDIIKTPVGVFCGLGIPNGFLATLNKIGIKVVASYILPDHVKITQKELNLLSYKTKMRKGEFILCSEKDAVKLNHIEYSELLLPIGVVQVDLKLYDQEKNAEKLLEKLAAQLQGGVVNEIVG